MTLEALKSAGKNFLQKCKADRRVPVLLFAGLLLLAAVAVFDFRESKPPKTEPAQTASEIFRETDEEKLGALLEQIRGAGKTAVMITYSEQTQFVYAAESDSETEADVNGEHRKKEKREPVILKGGETQAGLVERTLSPKVQGVAVVCEGASDPTVRSQILTAVSALFGLGINHISVAEMAGQEEPS